MLGSNCILERYPWEQFTFMPTKEVIRSKIRALRASLDDETSVAEGRRAARILGSWMNRRGPWLLYSSIQNEISTQPLFEELRSRKIRVGFPRIDSDRIVFHEVDDLKTLTQGRFSLEPQPTAPEIRDTSGVIIVPGLAFSISGQRLGFGRGFYDRFLNQFPHFVRIGFGYDFQLFPNTLPTLPHDEVLDFVACPSGLWGSSRICSS